MKPRTSQFSLSQPKLTVTFTPMKSRKATSWLKGEIFFAIYMVSFFEKETFLVSPGVFQIVVQAVREVMDSQGLHSTPSPLFHP